MKYWNQTLRNMTGYVPGEQPEDIDSFIKLNTNENPFPPSERVLEAVAKAANGKLRLYPNPQASPLREEFARRNDLQPEQIVIGNGSDEIITLIFRGFIEKDGKAAFPYPSYSLYDTLAQANGISFDHVPLREDFSVDFEAFLQGGYDLVILASPNNPTGTATSSQDIDNFAGRFNGLLVVDEAYIDFYGGSSLDLVKKHDNLIVTRSFSKSYSLAGMRIGVAAANPDIIRGFLRIKDSYNVDTLAIAGGLAALKDEKSFRYNITMIQHNKEYLEERLESLGFETVPSWANFIFTRHPDMEAREIYEKLKEKKILVRHFKGEGVSGYVRISIGSMMEIKKLCTAIEAIMGGE
jgi:histidinol-phosphate aminotransferase